MTFFFHFIIYKTLNAGAEIEAFFFFTAAFEPILSACPETLTHEHI